MIFTDGTSVIQYGMVKVKGRAIKVAKGKEERRPVRVKFPPHLGWFIHR
jgi:hypothetical protein